MIIATSVCIVSRLFQANFRTLMDTDGDIQEQNGRVQWFVVGMRDIDFSKRNLEQSLSL